MLPILILIACMVLLVVVLGLPLLLGYDSPVPDYFGFGILAVAAAMITWGLGVWWTLIPIAALAVFVIWLDSGGQDAPAGPAPLDHRGWSARTRLRFRLWIAANLAIPALIASPFVLPEGSGSPELFFAGLVIAMTAMSLFRFSFCRSVRRDDLG